MASELERLREFFSAEDATFDRITNGSIPSLGKPIKVATTVDCTAEVLALLAEAVRLENLVFYGETERDKLRVERIAELEESLLTVRRVAHREMTAERPGVQERIEALEAERDVAQVAMRMMERAGQNTDARADARIAELERQLAEAQPFDLAAIRELLVASSIEEVNRLSVGEWMQSVVKAADRVRQSEQSVSSRLHAGGKNE